MIKCKVTISMIKVTRKREDDSLFSLQLISLSLFIFHF